MSPAESYSAIGLAFGDKEVIERIDGELARIVAGDRLKQSAARVVLTNDAILSGDIEVAAGIDREATRLAFSVRQRQGFDEDTRGFELLQPIFAREHALLFWSDWDAVGDVDGTAGTDGELHGVAAFIELAVAGTFDPSGAICGDRGCADLGGAGTVRSSGKTKNPAAAALAQSDIGVGEAAPLNSIA